jgi:hypothetical protein
MTLRSAVAVLLTVVIVISVIELSTWVLGHAMSTVVPSASVSDVDTAVPQASEVDAPAPTAAPSLTW